MIWAGPPYSLSFAPIAATRGLGVPRPWPSWGSMLRDSQQYIYLVWWFPLIPGLAITLLVMSANLTGDWLRDRFDPTRRQL